MNLHFLPGGKNLAIYTLLGWALACAASFGVGYAFHFYTLWAGLEPPHVLWRLAAISLGLAVVAWAGLVGVWLWKRLDCGTT